MQIIRSGQDAINRVVRPDEDGTLLIPRSNLVGLRKTHVLTMAQGSGNNFGWVFNNFGDIDSRVMVGFTEPLSQVRLDTDTSIFRIQWNITGTQPQVLGLRLLFEGGVIECPRLTPTSNGFETPASAPFEAAWIAMIGLSFPIRIEVIT